MGVIVLKLEGKKDLLLQLLHPSRLVNMTVIYALQR